MNKFIGLILVLAAIVLGVWAGAWWAFIGGIVLIVHSVQAAPIDALGIAYGIARVWFAGLIGVVTFFVLGSIGVAVAEA